MMQLYILRHGQAAHDVAPDRERPLTRQGRTDTDNVLARCAEDLATIDVVISSPLRRARETAALALQYTTPGTRLLISDLLIPDGSPDSVVSFLADQRIQRCLLVGHQPLAGILVGYLSGHPAPQLTTSALVSLEVFSWCAGGARERWIQEPGHPGLL